MIEGDELTEKIIEDYNNFCNEDYEYELICNEDGDGLALPLK
jgi:hypothetical protein